ncbi:META domain-containing protein [Hymenobacter pini]|uniref:META domain-containing protein n=1 Tax=Hymenobacter pini TaxID=2880879 RepID=UPI001CF4A3B4|nr:META domain-containing protein [Hymenobacter pini]MCA8829669.1 META domain-containing protein [Hymenobacter pini]
MLRYSPFFFLLLTACQTTAPATETTTSAQAAPTTELRGTKWVLHSLAGQPVQPTSTKELYLLISPDQPQAEGQASCNRFRGPVELPAAQQLRFGALMSTRMACPDLAIETSFTNALTNTRTYQISRDTLRLYGEPAAGPLAELHQGR